MTAEQMFFNFKKEEEKPKPEIEKINCQYCQDVGPCSFCPNGQEIIKEIKNKNAR